MSKLKNERESVAKEYARLYLEMLGLDGRVPLWRDGFIGGDLFVGGVVQYVSWRDVVTSVDTGELTLQSTLNNNN